jgi:hypothetical protein
VKDYELRVVEEKAALDMKIEKLEAFTESDIYSALDDVDRDNLDEQLLVMQRYSEILANRIDRFEESK